VPAPVGAVGLGLLANEAVGERLVVVVVLRCLVLGHAVEVRLAVEVVAVVTGRQGLAVEYLPRVFCARQIK
jgi:hypothetical protein